jgi:N-methylhydantoinase A/oxoprolinase/acetone carboxylase beta subunit
VYLGEDLKPGMVLPGPGVIAEPTTTVVLEPDSTATVTAHNNYLIENESVQSQE